ncbi:MAG: hypothetical protein EOO65_01850 [Methanosarcinales archaeon]|nr:MAG: hypothetical protein EOO65_01850 [Methanosarcinales archaeon]
MHTRARAVARRADKQGATCRVLGRERATVGTRGAAAARIPPALCSGTAAAATRQSTAMRARMDAPRASRALRCCMRTHRVASRAV